MLWRSIFARLVQWYVYEIPRNWWVAARHTGPFVVELMGLKIHGRSFFKPMFHDVTWVGRFLSLGFRVLFIFSGLLMLVFSLGVVGLFLPVWFGIHGLWFVSWELGLLMEVMLVLLFVMRLLSDKPWDYVYGNYSWGKLLEASPGWLVGLLEGFPENEKAWMSRSRVNWWWGRLGVREVPVSIFDEMKAMKRGDVQRTFGKTVWDVVVEMGGDYVTMGDVLVAWVRLSERFREELRAQDIYEEDVEEVCRWYRRELDWWGRFMIWDHRFSVHEGAGFNRGLTGTPTRILDRFSVDLTRNAGHLYELVGREEQMEQLLDVLRRSDGENVLIVGADGVGKSTMVGQLARMIMRGDAPEIIADKRVVKLEPGRLLAGAGNSGELAGRMVALLDEITRSEDIILFVDGMHTLMTDQGGAGANLFTILDEALQSSRIAVIGTTTVKAYKQFLEPNSSLMQIFERIYMEEPDDETSVRILENLTHDIERVHKVVLSLPALKAAVQLSKRYIQTEVLPDKARDVLDEAAVRVVGNGRQVVRPEDVAAVITSRTGIPTGSAKADEKKKLLHLEEEIHRGFVAQDVAVQTVADALRRARIDVRNEQRPIGAFLFVGPTGVGKTELSKQLAKIYFGSEERMIRLDMTEFSREDMISRLVGAPVGTVGYGLGGELTEKVKLQPFSLILLDELEKAHPKVWDLLMQVLEDGRLTDSAGEVVNFTNTIIIATSNAVTDYIRGELGKGVTLEEMKGNLTEELQRTFRIEFVNRFDAVVPFGPLEHEQMMVVVKLELERLNKRLKSKQMSITYTKDLVEKIAGYAEEKHLGARPIRRIIQDRIEAFIARKVLETDDVRGMVVTLDEGVLGE